MPIYEYQCKACGHRLEKLQKLSAAPLTDCPSCEASSLSRLVSAAGFRLAGGGWYETDFKSGDNKKNLAGDQKPGAKDGTGSKQGSDPKQASGSKQDGGSAPDAKPTAKKDTAV